MIQFWFVMNSNINAGQVYTPTDNNGNIKIIAKPFFLGQTRLPYVKIEVLMYMK